MALSERHIELIKSYFSDKPVLKVYLFGSQNNSSANEKSDVDLLVDLDYTQHIGLQFFGMQLDLENLLGKKVDLVSSNGISKFIKAVVDQNKKLIYAK